MGTSELVETSFSEEELLADFQPFASEFQMDAFVIGGSGYHHIWGMYKQALRELRIRRKNREEHVRLIEECQHKIPRTVEPVECSRLESQIEELTLTAADNDREWVFYYDKAKELKAQIGDLTDERRRELDLDFWAHKHAYTLGIAFESQHGPPDSFWEVLPGFPPDIRSALVEMARRPLVAHKYLEAFLSTEDLDCTLTFRDRFPAAVQSADTLIQNKRLAEAEKRVRRLPVVDAGYRVQLPDEVE